MNFCFRTEDPYLLMILGCFLRISRFIQKLSFFRNRRYHFRNPLIKSYGLVRRSDYGLSYGAPYNKETLKSLNISYKIDKTG